MAQPGYKFSRARFDSVLTIPKGLGNLKNISGGQDTGQIRFNVSDSSVYVWNGRAWISSTSAIPNLQQVTDVGNTTTNSISITDQMFNASLSLLPSKLEFTVTGGGSTLLPSNGTTTQLTFPNAAGGFTIPIKVNGIAAGSNGNITIPTTDTTSLSNRINLKVNISDTAAMLTAYRNAINTNSAQGTANAAAIQQRIDSVRNNAGVLEARKGGVFVPQFTLPATDTTSLSRRINLKVNITDTASMLSPYSKVTVSSYSKNATRDSTILLLSNGTRFAAKDSVGSGGGGANIYTSNGSLTSARTLTLNSQPLTIAGTVSSIFHANGNVGIGTTTDAGLKLDVNGTAKINSGFGNVTFTNQGGYQTAIKASSHMSFSAENSFEIYNTTAGQNLFLGTGGVVYLGNSITANGIAPVAIGYNGTAISAAAILDIKSTTRGVLFPRMTTTQKNAIASPAAGLVVYDTTLRKLCVYTTAWETITSL